jgi:membrane protease YdiL (CAAX protease family)
MGPGMPIRLRKLIGAVALIVLALVWALVAMALAQSPAIKANGLLEVIYYVIAGLGWVLPAMPLVKWMSGSAKPQNERGRTDQPSR